MNAPNPYLDLVRTYARLFRDGKNLPHGGLEPEPHNTPAPGAPRALIFSPHPDDECIIGALPLRLARQCGWQVSNVAVTQGSRKDRQEARWAELQNACRYLGFGLIQTAPRGLESINPKGRESQPAAWAESVKAIAGILRREMPRAIFFPHDADWNSTHIGTHLLVTDALRSLDAGFSTWTIETEYWGQMTDPNLMVESAEEEVAQLVSGTSFHAGEVSRNPFHLLLPAWMQDNVRRGSELVGGQGEAAPDFGFATLYRVRRWNAGQFEKTFERGQLLPASARPDSVFG